MVLFLLASVHLDEIGANIYTEKCKFRMPGFLSSIA